MKCSFLKSKLTMMICAAALALALPFTAYAEQTTEAQPGATESEISVAAVSAGIEETENGICVDFSQMPEGENVYEYTGTKPLTLKGSGTVVLNNVKISAPEGISAIALAPGADITAQIVGDCRVAGGTGGAGIAVPEKTVLTITGDGTLYAVGNGGIDNTSMGSGIGGSTVNGGSCGTICVDGLGGLTAEGYGKHAAGIGGEKSDGIVLRNTTVDTVRGGFVQSAFVSSYGKSDAEGGPAIGSGMGDTTELVDITLENVTIHHALGGSKAAAIGSGYHANAKVQIVSCTLEEVIGGAGSAGIGGSRINAGGAATVSIVNSTVTVTGGECGAGIGLGYNINSVENDQPSGNISIAGSSIYAVGGKGGAGIGGGYKSHNLTISIDGASSVYAQSGALIKAELGQGSAAAIGCGALGSGLQTNPATGAKNDDSGTSNAITIAQGADVIAVAQGGRWAIDCGTESVTAPILQMRFLNEDLCGEVQPKGWVITKSNPYDYQEKEQPALDTLAMYDGKTTQLKVGNRTITLPENYYTAAVSQSGNGTYTVNGANFGETFASYTVEGFADASADYTVSGLTRFDHVALRPSVTPTPAPTPSATAQATAAAPTQAPDQNVTPEAAAVTVVRPAARPVAPTVPAAQQIADNETPLAATPAPTQQTEVEVIAEQQTPLSGGSWALVNFALMNLAVFEALMLLFGYLSKQMHEKSDANKQGIMRLLSLPVAAVSAIAFCLTENIHLMTVLVDKWTLLMAAIALVQTILVVLVRRKAEQELTHEQPADTENEPEK